MTPAKLNVFFSFYPYGTNGGTKSEHPNIRNWFARTLVKCKADPRIGETHTDDFADVPPPMNRNAAVLAARKAKCDVLVMVDSDQEVDLYPDAKPFWDTSFDFLYERKMKGQVTVIAAPYCGPPPNEVCYVFEWSTMESHHANADMKLAMVQREVAAQMSGIHPAAALPTGLIMFDMEIFEITDPRHEFEALLKEHPRHVAEALVKPWFYYEWKNIYAAEKASTEDVTATRDMNLLATHKLGYSPVFCNWDAWAGHYKPKCVGKPMLLTTDMVNEKYRAAVLAGRDRADKIVDVATLNPPDWRNRMEKVPRPNVPQEAHVNGSVITMTKE